MFERHNADVLSQLHTNSGFQYEASSEGTCDTEVVRIWSMRQLVFVVMIPVSMVQLT
jgi:hypothetical protein